MTDASSERQETVGQLDLYNETKSYLGTLKGSGIVALDNKISNQMSDFSSETFYKNSFVWIISENF